MRSVNEWGKALLFGFLTMLGVGFLTMLGGIVALAVFVSIIGCSDTNPVSQEPEVVAPQPDFRPNDLEELDDIYLIDEGHYASNYNTVTFVISTEDYWDYDILWSLGDGTHSTEFTPEHTYKDTGTYTVVLTLDDKWVAKKITITGKYE